MSMVMEEEAKRRTGKRKAALAANHSGKNDGSRGLQYAAVRDRRMGR